MKNYDQSVETNHHTNLPYIPDHPYRILIIVGSGSGKLTALLNLIKNQRADIHKFIYMSKIHLDISINCLLMEGEK